MNSETAFRYLAQNRIMAGTRGNFPPAVAVPMATVLMSEDINIFELTMNSVQPIEAMQAIKREFGADCLAGMGTVLDVETAKRVIDAGADFIVSPAFQPEVVQVALDADVLIGPGVLTPSEAIQAWDMGVKFLKIFPIGVMGVEYFKAITGPLNHLKFMCNGGMNDNNAREFFAAGAFAAGMANWLTGDGTWPAEKLKTRARSLREIVKELQTGIKQSQVV